MSGMFSYWDTRLSQLENMAVQSTIRSNRVRRAIKNDLIAQQTKIHLAKLNKNCSFTVDKHAFLIKYWVDF